MLVAAICGKMAVSGVQEKISARTSFFRLVFQLK